MTKMQTVYSKHALFVPNKTKHRNKLKFAFQIENLESKRLQKTKQKQIHAFFLDG